MKSESLISWNIPNFVSFVLMISIIWVVIGTAGHVLVRQPAKRRAGGGIPPVTRSSPGLSDGVSG